MLLKAKVFNVEVKKNPAFHEKTGESDPSYFLEATAIDLETGQGYHCSFRETPEVQLLQKAYKDKLPEEQRDQIAAQAEAQAKHRLDKPETTLIVIDIRIHQGFITLLVKYS